MKVLVSGGTGSVGRHIVESFLSAGYKVAVGGRTAPKPGLFSRAVSFIPLSLDPDLDQIDAFDDAYVFVHCAFDHAAGKYRGGEGNDPERFRRLNVDGSVRLFENALRAGTRRCIFISSRAAYGMQPPGTVLTEDLHTVPDTLYGEIKILAGRSLNALSSPSFVTTCLRVTGVYDALSPNKWDGLISDYLQGRPVASRAGTEVHGQDVGAAVRLIVETESARVNRQIFNVSDLLTDTHDILSVVRDRTGCHHELPPVASRDIYNVMSTDKLRALGWVPGGRPLLADTIRSLVETR